MPGKKREWGGKVEKQFLRLLEQGHTIPDIGRFMEASASTLRRHYGRFIRAHKEDRLGDIWTEEQRGMVQAMAAFGIPYEQVANVLSISQDALEANFAEELRQGTPIANAQVAAWLFGACRDGDVSAMKFYLGCRAGWTPHIGLRGKVDHEHTHEHSVGDPEVRAVMATLDAEGREALRLALEQLGAESAIDSEGPGEEDTVH